MKPNFKLEYNILKNKIFCESKPKRFKNKPLNGGTLAELITSFIDSMNKGVVPNISNTWDEIVIKEINDFYENSLLKYKNSVKSFTEISEQEDLAILVYKENYSANLSMFDIIKKNPDITYNNKYLNIYEDKKNTLIKQVDILSGKCLEENNEKTRK